MSSAPAPCDYRAYVHLHPSGAPRRAARATAALLRSCHPEPAFAVTAFVTALAVAAGRGAAGSVAVAAAALTGQLSVGWCNDAADARRDALCRREDKPVARGDLPPRAVAVAAGRGALAVVVSGPSWCPGRCGRCPARVCRATVARSRKTG